MLFVSHSVVAALNGGEVVVDGELSFGLFSSSDNFQHCYAAVANPLVPEVLNGRQILKSQQKFYGILLIVVMTRMLQNWGRSMSTKVMAVIFV